MFIVVSSSPNIHCLLHFKNRHNSFKMNKMFGLASFDTCREEKLDVHRERAASGWKYVPCRMPSTVLPNVRSVSLSSIWKTGSRSSPNFFPDETAEFFIFSFNWYITADWLGLQSFYDDDDDFATFVYNFYWILAKEFILLGAVTNFHFQ